MSLVRVEFTIEPFVDAHPGAHVQAAWQAVRERGCELSTGPFSSEAIVPAALADAVVGDVVRAAVSHGAERVSVQIERIET